MDKTKRVELDMVVQTPDGTFAVETFAQAQGVVNHHGRGLVYKRVTTREITDFLCERLPEEEER